MFNLSKDNHLAMEEGAIKGVPVVFLLDTSRSMRGEGFDQMKEVFLSMIQSKHWCLCIVCNDIIVITSAYYLHGFDVSKCLDNITTLFLYFICNSCTRNGLIKKFDFNF